MDEHEMFVPLTEHCKDVLRRVLGRVEKEPRRFNMHEWYEDVVEWVGDDPNVEMNWLMDGLGKVKDLPPCGAVACLAGNICLECGLAEVAWTTNKKGEILNHYRQPSEGWFEAAREELGITTTQAYLLFNPHEGYIGEGAGPSSYMYSHTYFWPEPFATEYHEAIDANDHQRGYEILKARVEHFIVKDGRA